MKKNIIYCFLIAGLFSSCKKDLKEKVYGSFSDLNSVSTINSAALGMYQSMQLGEQRSVYPMIETGGRYNAYGFSGDGLGNRDFYRYIYNNRTPEFNAAWNYYYMLINRNNEVIEATQNVIRDTTVANPIIAEARCLRAWNHFVLTQFFGDIPIEIKATNTSNQNENNTPRSPVADVYAQIVADLNYASAVFPNGKTRLPLTRDNANLGRVTSATALAMLGKVYLTMAGKPLMDPNGYTNAINTFKILVDQRVKYNTDLLPKGNYARIFAPTNEMNKEILFANRAFANSTNLIFGSAFPTMLSPIFSDFNAGAGATIQANISQNFGLRSDIVDLFQSTPATTPERLGDIRLREGIGFIYADQRAVALNATTGVKDSVVYNLTTKRYVLYKAGQNVITPPSTTLPNIVYGINAANGTAAAPAPGYGLGFTKWRVETQWSQNNIRGHNNDWIMLRFADVLLSYAEALNENGQTAVAIPFLNEVRLRANARAIALTTSQIDLKKIIREERTRELIGEFTTVFDMRRWGTVKENMDALQTDQFAPSFVSIFPVYEEKYNLYPIPYAQTAINPKLTQNLGWN